MHESAHDMEQNLNSPPVSIPTPCFGRYSIPHWRLHIGNASELKEGSVVRKLPSSDCLQLGAEFITPQELRLQKFFNELTLMLEQWSKCLFHNNVHKGTGQVDDTIKPKPTFK